MSVSKLKLIFTKSKNHPPEVTLQERDRVKFIKPMFGYDLCDFVSLQRDKENRLYKKISSNYYNYNNGALINDILGIPKKIISYSKNIHPYFYFDLFDPNIDNETDICDKEICDWQSEKTINIAHWELSQFFDIAEEHGFSLTLFQNFIDKYFTIPSCSFGTISSFGRISEHSSSGKKAYENSLKERKKYLNINSYTQYPTIYYHCENLTDIVVAYTYYALNLGYTFKKCKNCGKWFIPHHRSDTLYCDRFAPQDETKTCKEYGAQKAYIENLEKDESKNLYRKIYQRLKMRINRNPDIDFHSKTLEDFKINAYRFKNDIKKGKASNDEYKEWLLDFYDRNFERRNPNG